MSIITNGAMAVATNTAAGVIGGTSADAVAIGTKAGLGLKAKIAIAVVATVVVGGGAAVIINSQSKKDESSKNIEQYETIEPMSADELRDYFVEEYGFVQQLNYDIHDKNNSDKEQMMGYQLTLENENGGVRVEIQYYVEGNRVKDIKLYNFQKEGKDNLETYKEICSLLIDNSEEKEQLTKLIEAYVDEEKQIGNEIYNFHPEGNVYYNPLELGFSEPVDITCVLVIIVDW